jgi:hypothetical protein
MGTIYRVTVVAETTDAQGGYESSETLFELAGGADMVARIAPSALGDALSAEAPETLADRVMDGAAAAGAPVEQRPRRPRRTKAQIAADEAAVAAGFRDAAHRAEVESHDAEPRLPHPDPTVAAGMAAAPSPAGPVTAQAMAGTMPPPPPAGDYNPFGA